MATSPGLATSDLDRLLLTLPRQYALAGVGEARFVAGPAGAFVLQVTGADVEHDAQDLLHLTNATRVALSDHLPWVPFLDALLVTCEAADHHPDVTIVPADLLLAVLRDGHQALDESTMDRIFVLLAEHRLDPAWSLIGWSESDQLRNGSAWSSTAWAATALPS